MNVTITMDNEDIAFLIVLGINSWIACAIWVVIDEINEIRAGQGLLGAFPSDDFCLWCFIALVIFTCDILLAPFWLIHSGINAIARSLGWRKPHA